MTPIEHNMQMPFKSMGAPGLAMNSSNGSHSMYGGHSYGQPSMMPMYAQDPNLPNKYMFQHLPSKLIMSSMDARDFNSMPKQPMAGLDGQFNHSMNIGPNYNSGLALGMHHYPSANNSMTINPPGFTPHPAPNQTKPCYYPMGSRIDANSYPNHKTQNVYNESEPIQNKSNVFPVKIKEEKKTSLKPGSRTFKPSTAKTNTNSFMQPKAHESYKQAAIPGIDQFQNVSMMEKYNPQSSFNQFSSEFPPPPQNMNNTFSGAIPGMLPPPPMPPGAMMYYPGATPSNPMNYL
jgi:hypothetical protein